MRRASSQQSPSWRAAPIAAAVLAVGLGILVVRGLSDSESPSTPPDRPEPQPEISKTGARIHRAMPVTANRTADVPDGFRGDIHPILHGRTPLEVTAHWTGLEKSQLKFNIPEEIRGWYTGLRTAVPRAKYTARDFSAFLPESKANVGQVWALDTEKILLFLSQFHDRPSTHLMATGRRAGPDGAFALLRAMSPSHAEIVFRLHAEFLITPNVGGDQPVYAWFTPAYFHGRLLINKSRGTVEHFQMALPTEKTLNAFLTVNPSLQKIALLAHDIVRVERMELIGGDGRRADSLIWTESLSPAEASRKLAKVFYKFEEIDWVPVDQVQARARGKERPIFAIVSWGATDDQSC